MAGQREGAIVVGIDGTEKDGRAVDWAAAEAARSGGELRFLYSFPATPGGLGAVSLDNIEQIGARITDWARERALAGHPGITVRTQTVVDHPATVLVRESSPGTIVVLGARGLGRIAGRLLGSVSQKVAAHAHGVVVIVRDTPPNPDGPVVVGVDPVDTAPEVLEFAFTRAAQRRVGVRMVHAHPPLDFPVEDAVVRRVVTDAGDQAAQEVARLAEEWGARYPDAPVEVREVERHPVEALTEESAHSSLLVVGSRGRRGLTGLRLGSVARGVLHEAPVVAVVRVVPDA